MNRKKLIIIIALVAVVLAGVGVWAFSSGPDKGAAHTNYSAEENYGKGNYVFSTVTFTGSGMDRETVLSVKEIEQLAYDNDKDLGHEAKYSLLTSGSVFSQSTFTGVKLYETLLYLGMDKNLSDDTRITVVSSDGYTMVMTLGEIKSNKYFRFGSASDPKVEEEGLPVLLSFGSGGLPLVGPTGSEDKGKEMTEKDGFNEDAQNSGGPVKLTIGQKTCDDFNAPQNAKWVKEVIVGDPYEYTFHAGESGIEKALKVSVFDADSENERISSKEYTFDEIEKFASQKSENTEKNYYGEKDFYEGAGIWDFLREETEVAAREGTVKFNFSDGKSERVSLSYLRDLKGDHESYITEKEGLYITCVKPAFGYSKNGSPTELGELYALLPKDGKEKKKSTVKKCISVDVYVGNDFFGSENPYEDKGISIEGNGMEEDVHISIEEIEKQIDLAASSGDYKGVSLIGLLEEKGLAVDAQKAVIESSSGIMKISISTLKKEGNTILATRKRGKALDEEEGPLALRGRDELNNVKKIIVYAKDGKWSHSYKGYKKYLGKKVKITGSEAAADRTYTLKELESLGDAYTVKDSFGAGGGTNAFCGVILKKLVNDNLKDGIKRPSRITVEGKDGYSISISVGDIYNGIESKYQPGERRDIILAYSIDGSPMVPGEKSTGYKGGNAFGPIRLVVENQTSKWVKNVNRIILGE